MAYSKIPFISINPATKKEIEYQEKRALWGAIKCYVKVSEKSLEEDLIISTTEKFDKIIYNGRVIDLTPEK